MGVSVSPRNARIAEMMMSGSTFAEVASELGIDENRVRTYVIRLRQRGIPIPQQKRFKLIAISDSGERFEFVGKKDVFRFQPVFFDDFRNFLPCARVDYYCITLFLKYIAVGF